MEKFPKALANKLTEREQAASLRKLPAPNNLVDFSSNDYLGFARSSAIRQMAGEILSQMQSQSNGATGSRLISGNHSLYEETENFIAGFHNAEKALIFNSGYDANVGLFSSVPQKGDVIFYDEYIHASIRDGIRLSNAQSYKFSHNGFDALENALQRHANAPGWEIYVVTESVFSMDGDSPDIALLINLCEKYNARLIVDEAHALGVIGTSGEGLVQSLNLQDRIFARVITFGKGLGCHGAAIVGSNMLKQYLVNFARSFIYTTGLPPHSVATILAAYKQLQKDASSKNQLILHVSFFQSEVERLGLEMFVNSGSAIHCAIVPGNKNVKFCASVLQEKGYDVKAILSPTVPQGQERLRFCLHSYNTPEEITGVLEALKANLQYRG